MRQTVKYMYAIKSEWITFDTVKSFEPFVTSLLINNKVEKGLIEDISSIFFKEYGFKMPYFILTNIVISYISRGYVTNKNPFLYFHLDKMIDLPQISSREVSAFESQFNSLINDFKLFCNSSDVTDKVAEKTIMSFVKKYDALLIGSNIEIEEDEDIEVEMYFFHNFLKEQIESNTSNYKFIAKLCQGNLIKSYLFNEGIEDLTITEQDIYLDSPILYRILGYYGEYFEDEYKYLLSLWLEKKANIYIYRHNYDELINVLERTISFLKDVNFNYAKAPRIALNFKQEGISPIDVEEKLLRLPETLESLGIEINEVNITDLDEKYIEDEEEIRKLIKTTYMSSGRYNEKDLSTFTMSKMIDNDVRSIVLSYGLRESNKARNFDDNQFFYVTNNTGMFKSALVYNDSYYQGTISPVIRDSLIGMITSSKDLNKINKLVEKSIISACYSAHKPSKNVLRKFNELVDNMKNTNQLTDEQFLTLKHNKAVLPNLVLFTNVSNYDLNYETINHLLAKLESDILNPVVKDFETEIKEIIMEKDKLIASNEKLRKELISSKNIGEESKKLHQKSVKREEAFKTKLELLKKEEFELFKKKIYKNIRITIIISTFVNVVASIVVFFRNKQFDIWNILLTIFFIIQTSFAAYTFVIKNKGKDIKSIKRYFEKKNEEIDKKYKIDNVEHEQVD